MFGIGKLKQELDQLRNDMAAEFVKRDKVIEAHTTHLETFHKLVEGWAKDLGNLDKRVEQLKELETVNESLDGIWKNLVMTVDVVRGLMRYLDVDRDKMMECIKAAKEEMEKMMAEMPQSRSKKKYEAPKAEPALEAEETLFSGLDEYIDSAEARQMLGWKSLSTTMLRRMNIRYQQPKGRYHRLTVHKGDCEKFISNRIVRKKKN